MCVCVCVCVCVYMYVCMHKFNYTYAWTLAMIKNKIAMQRNIALTRTESRSFQYISAIKERPELDHRVVP